VKEFGSGSRATFISPYLRRPLRSLNKVLSERDEEVEEGLPQEPANDSHAEAAAAVWHSPRKPFVVSD